MRQRNFLIVLIALWLLSAAGVGQAVPSAIAAQAASRLGASSTLGLEARGTLHILGPGSDRAARFDLLTLGAHHHLLVIEVPGQGVYRAVVNSGQSQVRQPVGLLALPQPGGFDDFCDFLPQASLLADLNSGQAAAADQGLASGLPVAAERIHFVRAGTAAPSPSSGSMDLDLDAATSLPVRIAYTTAHGQQVVVTYSKYLQTGGIEYPSRIEKSINGQLKLALDITSLTLRSDLSDADFAVPAPRKH